MSTLGAAGHYIHEVLIGVDQLGNALLAGNAGETISSRLNREDIVPLLGPIVRAALNAIKKDHTKLAYEYDDLGLPAPHHLPELARAALEHALKMGDDYLSLSPAELKEAKGGRAMHGAVGNATQRLRAAAKAGYAHVAFECGEPVYEISARGRTALGPHGGLPDADRFMRFLKENR